MSRRRSVAALAVPVPDQLDLFEVPQQRNPSTRKTYRRRPSAPLVDELTYSRTTQGDCDRCTDEQAAAYEAGDTTSRRRRARWVRAGGGLPTELLCSAHKAADESTVRSAR